VINGNVVGLFIIGILFTIAQLLVAYFIIKRAVVNGVLEVLEKLGRDDWAKETLGVVVRNANRMTQPPVDSNSS
jgi:hypothetical protein